MRQAQSLRHYDLGYCQAHRYWAPHCRSRWDRYRMRPACRYLVQSSVHDVARKTSGYSQHVLTLETAKETLLQKRIPNSEYTIVASHLGGIAVLNNAYETRRSLPVIALDKVYESYTVVGTLSSVPGRGVRGNASPRAFSLAPL
jgi:hypothetical protein